MDWQLTTVAVLVMAALAYLGRQTWRTWFGRKSGCGGGCGCSKPAERNGQAALIPAEQLTLRRRERG